MCSELLKFFGATTHHALVDGVGRLVGKDAGREAGDELLHVVLVAAGHHVVVHAHVLAEKVAVGPQVGVQPAHPGGQVDDVGGPVLDEEGLGGGQVEQVGVLAAQEDPVLVGPK